jgi:UrcA family protein
MNPNVNGNAGPFRAFWTTTLLASVLVVSSAFAGEQVRSETVRFQDLNVSTPAGVEALYTRIHSAARRVCHEHADWLAQLTEAACVRKAEAGAIDTLSLPGLTAYYRAKTGTRAETRIATR